MKIRRHLLNILDAAFQWRPLFLQPRFFAPAVAVIYLVSVFMLLDRTIGDPNSLDRLVGRNGYSGDTPSYIQIGEAFASGDFTMSYVKRRPYRQPLYPLLLAAPIAVAGDDPFWLGTVNVLIGCITVLCLYFSILRFYCQPLIAALAGLLFAINPFFVDHVSARIMTEPTHFLLTILVIHFFLDYVACRRRSALFLAFGACGMEYLARPNGLFLMGAMAVVLIAADLCAAFSGAVGHSDRLLPSAQAKESDPQSSGIGVPSRSVRLGAVALTYVAGTLIFVVVTMPSWVPRVRYFQNPISHGFLSNYLWVDTLKEANTGKPYPSYTWNDYAATHTLWDVLDRWEDGIYEVCFVTPIKQERLPILYFLAVAGTVGAVFRRDRTHLLLAAFLMVQLLPLIWTWLPNHNRRVSYAGLFPFEPFFAAFALDQIRLWLAASVRPGVTSPESAG